MLDEENSIEEDRHHTQDELHYIECSLSEKSLSTSKSIYSYLSKTETSSCQVKQYVGERPSNGTLALPVEVHLGAVFNESNGGFGVSSY